MSLRGRSSICVRVSLRVCVSLLVFVSPRVRESAYLGFARGAAGVEDEEGVLRVAPLGLTLVRHAAQQSVPTRIHIWVPGNLGGDTKPTHTSRHTHTHKNIQADRGTHTSRERNTHTHTNDQIIVNQSRSI